MFISLIFLPAIFLPQQIVLIGGKIMGYWSSFCLKIFLSTKIIIKGEENIIKNKKFFIASSHQSMFETFFLQTIFNSPVFILKKELLMIPIFGLYLKKIGSISIKRNKISKENIGFFDDILKQVNSSDRPIIIFPQGTRLNSEDRTKFKKGVSRIYDELKISCQPIAINSGNTWPKNGSKKINTKLIISILKPIDAGLEKEIFLKKIENDIYSELDILN
ncbi:1-acyl-sn-glycerol-3-phosphate acyltransferase [Candidatus Pelagibacter sp.]|nr:1-acyl-sn-glycerol-3-phosphate acyltransferase [Candidatus Pelagibacter sp.]